MTDLKISDISSKKPSLKFKDLKVGDYFINASYPPSKLWLKTNGVPDISHCNSVLLTSGSRGLHNENDNVILVKKINIEYEI